MSENDSSQNNFIKNNFSINADIEIDEKTLEESEKQREKQRTQIEPLLNEMKAKIEEGKSKYSSKKDSGIFNDVNQNMPNSLLGMNNMNINSQYSNMNINNFNMNGKTLPNFNNNINMNNINFINNQGNNMGMNNNAFINNQNLMNINNNFINNVMNNMNNNNEIKGINIDFEKDINEHFNKFNNINLNEINKNSLLKNNIINNNINNNAQDIINSNDNINEIIPNSNLDDNSKNSKMNPKEEILTPLNKNNFDQEKLDSIKKSQIIERHSERYCNYYDYTPGETEGNLNELLEDINYFGETTKMDIEKELKSNPDKFIPLEDALEGGDENEFFVLGLLGKVLEAQGCLVVIEKDKPKTSEENKEINTTLQFLVNNMYNFKKYIFYFDFGEEKNKEMLENEDKRHYFNSQLKKRLLYKFNLNESDIIMTNPRKGSYQITAIIRKLTYNNYTPEKLLAELKEDIDFNDIQKVEKGILLSGCKLNPFMLDERGDNCDGGWGFNETRGNHPYYPPEGWYGFGLRVIDRFDNGNNAWIDYRNEEGEWSVAYHGVGSLLGNSEALNIMNFFSMKNLQTGIRQNFKDSNDFYHKGKKVGEGVYVTPNPKILEEYCPPFNYNGTNYKIGFMTRVQPEKIRCPEEEHDYWVINGTDNEIRPYRILIKEIKDENKDKNKVQDQDQDLDEED